MALVPWTTAWQGTPLGSQVGSVLDDVIREDKEQVARRLEQGGHILTADPNTVGHGVAQVDARDGRHVVGGGGAGVSPDIYNSDANTKLVTYTNDSVVIKSDAVFTAPGVTAGLNPGHAHDTTISFPITSTAVGVSPGVILENRGNSSLTIFEARLIAGVAPLGGTCVANLRRLPTTYGAIASPYDAAHTYAAVYGVGNEPSLAAGEWKGTVASTLSTNTLAVGEAWVAEVVSNSGNARDLVLAIKVRRA